MCALDKSAKKGQISIEVMYSVGVMLIVFFILSGLTFNQRSDLRHLDDILERKIECLKLSNAITETSIVTENAYSDIFLKYNTTLYRDGVIIIAGQDERKISTDTSCTFTAYINTDKPAINLTRGVVQIVNNRGNVSIVSLGT